METRGLRSVVSEKPDLNKQVLYKVLLQLQS